jgi:hypothetical protein
MKSFCELAPCGNWHHGICDDPLQLLVGGGDRSASDPIQQIQKNQQSEAEDFPNRGTYLRSSSHTGSEAAFVHLADLR